MRTSKYNIIRFVLDVAYDDHRMTSAEPDWEGWLHKVSRMFCGKPPPALLAGLASKSEEMHELCNKMPSVSGEKPCAADLEAAWLLRRDAGNRRVAEQRVREKEAATVYNNSGYGDEDETFRGMKAVWDKRLDEYIRMRDRGCVRGRNH